MPGPQRTRQRQPKLVQGSDLRERRDIGPKTGLAGCDTRYVWGLLGVCSAIQRPEKVGVGGMTSCIVEYSLVVFFLAFYISILH